MKRFLAPSVLVLSVLLTACSGGQAPRTAEFVPPAPAETDFGSLRVRYNALPTLALSDAVAKQYGVQRDAGTALVLVALREVKRSRGQIFGSGRAIIPISRAAPSAATSARRPPPGRRRVRSIRRSPRAA